LTGIHPSTHIPDSATTAGTRWTGTPRKQIEGHLLTVGEDRHPALRVQAAHQSLRVPADFPLREGRKQCLRCRGRGRYRGAERHNQRDLAGTAQTSLDEVVVQHQRGLARGGRALERCRGDTDDNPSATERVQHVAAGEGAVDGVELTAGLDQPRRRRRVQVRAQSHHHHVGPECAGVGLHPAPNRVDGPDRDLDEPDTRLDQVAVRMADSLRRGAAEHHVELGEAEHESVGFIDQHDVDRIAQLVRESGGQLQAAETGAEHENWHGPSHFVW
jgi:hypothetical protein